MRGSAPGLRALAVAVVLAFGLPAIASAQPFDSMYVFGDSLVDTGNIYAYTRALGIDPPGPPSVSPHRTYFNGRFSNGPVSVEYLWHSLSGNPPGTPGGLQPILALPGGGTPRAVNFAFGGTGTPFLDRIPGGLWAPGLRGQVAMFGAALAGRRPSPGALFVIATGSNDYRDDEFNTPFSPLRVVFNIVDSIDKLYKLGARNVMVFDLPDTSYLPGGDPDGAALAQVHNALLKLGLSGLAERHPDLRIIPIALNDLFPVLISAGFVPGVPALGPLVPAPGLNGVFAYECLFVLPAACQDAPFDVIGILGVPFLFWDVVHPTTDAHQALGQFMFNALTP
jgi:phospholipase/lecithinase/hemolysin